MLADSQMYISNGDLTWLSTQRTFRVARWLRKSKPHQKPYAEVSSDPVLVFRYRCSYIISMYEDTQLNLGQHRELALQTSFLEPPNSCATVNSQWLTLRVQLESASTCVTCGANHQLSVKSIIALLTVKSFTHRLQICVANQQLSIPLSAPLRSNATAVSLRHSRAASALSNYIFYVPHWMLDP